MILIYSQQLLFSFLLLNFAKIPRIPIYLQSHSSLLIMSQGELDYSKKVFIKSWHCLFREEKRLMFYQFNRCPCSRISLTDVSKLTTVQCVCTYRNYYQLVQLPEISVYNMCVSTMACQHRRRIYKEAKANYRHWFLGENGSPHASIKGSRRIDGRRAGSKVWGDVTYCVLHIYYKTNGFPSNVLLHSSK